MKIQKQLFFGLFLLALRLCADPAIADESIYGYIYTTDSVPAGHWELEQTQTLRAGKARGTYRSLDFKSEAEYGITDRLSAAFYVKSSQLNMQNVYDAEDSSKNLQDTNKFDFNGTSLEFKYRVLSPYLDPIGLSVYVEPELGVRDQQTGGDAIERALEFRLILHKTYLDDTLIFASNLMLEPEWERADGKTSRELWGEFTFGSSYRVASNWWVGAEFRNHREFPGMSFGTQEHSAFFLGPNVHYGAKDYWLTLTLLPQIAGIPGNLGTGIDGKAIDGGSLHLGQHEKFEARLKFGINL